jgi:hypothetical protein
MYPCRLWEDDGIVGSGMARVQRRRGLWTSRARGGRHCCTLGNGVVGLGTAYALSTASSARVGEDGGAEDLERTQQWHGGSGEVSTMARAPGRSIMAWALGKFWQPGSVSESLQGLGFAKAT